MLVETVWEAVRKTREGEHWEVVGHEVGHGHGGRGQGDPIGKAAREDGGSWLVVLGCWGGGSQLGWGGGEGLRRGGELIFGGETSRGGGDIRSSFFGGCC